jgi:hypothetical protein
MIGCMMQRPCWLRQKDLGFVKSVSRRLNERGRLSPGRIEAVELIHERSREVGERRFVLIGPAGGKRG